MLEDIDLDIDNSDGYYYKPDEFIPYYDNSRLIKYCYRAVKFERNEGQCGPRNLKERDEYNEEMYALMHQQLSPLYYFNYFKFMLKWKLLDTAELKLLEDKDFCRLYLGIKVPFLSSSLTAKHVEVPVQTYYGDRYVYKDSRKTSDETGGPRHQSHLGSVLTSFMGDSKDILENVEHLKIPYYVTDDLADFEDKLEKGILAPCEHNIARDYKVLLLCYKNNAEDKKTYYIYKGVSFDDKGSTETTTPMLKCGKDNRYVFIFPDRILYMVFYKNVCKINSGAILYYNYTFSPNQYRNYRNATTTKSREKGYYYYIKNYIERCKITAAVKQYIPYGSGLVIAPKTPPITEGMSRLGILFHMTIGDYWASGVPCDKVWLEKRLEANGAGNDLEWLNKKVKPYLFCYNPDSKLFTDIRDNFDFVIPNMKAGRMHYCNSANMDAMLYGELDLLYKAGEKIEIVDYKTTNDASKVDIITSDEMAQMGVYRYILLDNKFNNNYSATNAVFHKIGPDYKPKDKPYDCSLSAESDPEVISFVDFVETVMNWLAVLRNAFIMGGPFTIDLAIKSVEDAYDEKIEEIEKARKP